MNRKHLTLELPADQYRLNELLADPMVTVEDTQFSSTTVDGEVRHYVLIVFRESEYIGA
jgi:hypothetical protein